MKLFSPVIIADTSGLPVDCVTIPETSSLGAAILARGDQEHENEKGREKPAHQKYRAVQCMAR